MTLRRKLCTCKRDTQIHGIQGTFTRFWEDTLLFATSCTEHTLCLSVCVYPCVCVCALIHLPPPSTTVLLLRLFCSPLTCLVALVAQIQAHTLNSVSIRRTCHTRARLQMLFDHQNKSTFMNGRDKTRPLVPVVSPSLMVADQTQLLSDSLFVLSPEGGSVEWLHVDVIDGHFAPNLSFCPDTVAALRKHMKHAFLDCHLMVTEPAKWIDVFAKAGASGFTFHHEATSDSVGLLRKIRAAGMQAGISIKPDTPVEVLYPLIDAGEVDMVLIMTVVPGFAGQKFMPGPVVKVRALRERYPHLNIQVDGAINLGTIETVAAAGANVVVPGQAVFKAADRRKSVEILRNTIQKHLPQRSKL